MAATYPIPHCSLHQGQELKGLRFNSGWDLSAGGVDPTSPSLDRWRGGNLYKPSVALVSGFAFRFNKLGLDQHSLGEDSVPHQQVEEALSFTPLGSAPLDREPLLSVDLGTAHSAAVTGE